MKTNCQYCTSDKNNTLCDRCNEVRICEECYWVIAPYEDDPFYQMYVCGECSSKFADKY